MLCFNFFSSARRAGGQNKNNGKALVPAGHTSRHPTNKPFFLVLKRRHTHKIPTIPPFKQNKRRPQHTGAAFAYFHFSQTASRNTAMRQPTHLFQIDNPHIPTGFINLFTEALPAVFTIYKPCQPFRHMQHSMLVMHIDEAAGNAYFA